MLKEIKADFLCDGCGKPFYVIIDPAQKIEDYSVFDYAEDMVRSGGGREIVFGYTSVKDGQHLCPECTYGIDTEYPDDNEPLPFGKCSLCGDFDMIDPVTHRCIPCEESLSRREEAHGTD